jgi:site-specific recombinase XerD
MGVSSEPTLTEDAMLDAYFAAPSSWAKLRSGCTGPWTDDFAAELRKAGYARSTGRHYLREVAMLGAWLEAHHLALISLDDGVLERFAARRGPCKCQGKHRYTCVHRAFGARLFLAFLRERVVVGPSLPPRVPRLLEQFQDWMLKQRGVRKSTVRTYSYPLVEFIESMGEPTAYTAGKVRQFVTRRAAGISVRYAQAGVTALRMFLRYLASRGLCSADLPDAIPRIAQWALASLPAYLSREDVERLVRAPDPSSSIGQRNRAILLLLARLGLRADDVRRLCLDDIDWRAGTVLVAGKSRRSTRLPLPQEVGDALLTYLATGRPRVSDPHVFLRADAPHTPLRGSSSISFMVRLTATRLGIRLPRGHAAHVLRHSLATAMVRDGVALPAIGVVLRHRSEDTTALYAKVDVSALRRIARPWPLSEVAPC